MPFINLSGVQSVNPDNVYTVTLDGRTIVLQSPAGIPVVLTYPDNASAIAAYPIIKAHLGGAAFFSFISPSQGGAGGGQVFVIVGGGFLGSGAGGLGGVSVTIGGLDTSANVLDSRTIMGTTQAHAAGGVDIVYVGADGQTFTVVNGYEYV